MIRPSPASLALLAALAITAARCIVGCAGSLSPAAGAAIDGAFAALCPFEALIPGAGPFLVGACPGEEALVAGAVAHGMAPADAGAAPVPAVGTAAAAMVAAPGNISGNNSATIRTAAPDSQADAGTSEHVGSWNISLGAPLYHRRTGHRRRHVGHAPAGFTAGQVARAQAWLDACPDADAGGGM